MAIRGTKMLSYRKLGEPESTRTLQFLSSHARFRQSERVPTTLCTIGTRLIDDKTWGHFKGKTIRFNSLFACTEALTAELRDAASKDDPEECGEAEEPMSLLMLELDNSDFTAEWPNGWKGQNEWVDEGEGCKWLANKFPADDLIVLGLSSFTIRAFGLILVRDHAYSAKGPMTYWRRLGYCEWWMTNLLDDQLLRPGSNFEVGMVEAWEAKYGPCLRVQSIDWVETEGIFG